jgi:hypothetical protein
MRIEKNEKINNIPVIKIRNYFRKARHYGFSKERIRNHFHLNENDVNLLINELIRNELIEQRNSYSAEYEYQLLRKGNALCAASCVPPISKQKADKIFNEFMQRVEEVNNDDYYLWRVNRLYLFGSYLNPNNNDFGDIDLLYILKRKIADEFIFQQRCRQRFTEEIAKGRRFKDIFERYAWPAKEVVRKLKNKNPYISLGPLSSVFDDLLVTEPNKQIYPVKNF